MNSSIQNDIAAYLPALRRFAYRFCGNDNDAEDEALRLVLIEGTSYEAAAQTCK